MADFDFRPKKKKDDARRQSMLKRNRPAESDSEEAEPSPPKRQHIESVPSPVRAPVAAPKVTQAMVSDTGFVFKRKDKPVEIPQRSSASTTSAKPSSSSVSSSSASSNLAVNVRKTASYDEYSRLHELIANNTSGSVRLSQLVERALDIALEHVDDAALLKECQQIKKRMLDEFLQELPFAVPDPKPQRDANDTEPPVSEEMVRSLQSELDALQREVDAWTACEAQYAPAVLSKRPSPASEVRIDPMALAVTLPDLSEVARCVDTVGSVYGEVVAQMDSVRDRVEHAEKLTARVEEEARVLARVVNAHDAQFTGASLDPFSK